MDQCYINMNVKILISEMDISDSHTSRNYLKVNFIRVMNIVETRFYCYWNFVISLCLCMELLNFIVPKHRKKFKRKSFCMELLRIYFIFQFRYFKHAFREKLINETSRHFNINITFRYLIIQIPIIDN